MGKRQFANWYIFLSLLIAFAIGVLGFVIIIKNPSFKETWDNSVYTENTVLFFFCVYFLFFLLYLAYLLQIILHESGHLIGGLLSGYGFVSFRIKNLVLVKDSGIFKLKKFSVAGTGGQCLMMPPEVDGNKYPYKIFIAGGVGMNLLFSMIALGVCVYIDFFFWLKIFCLLFSIVGIYIALTNGIPMKIGGVVNDGYLYCSLDKNKLACQSFMLQLKVNGLQTQGVRLRELPSDWFILPQEADLGDSLLAAVRMLEYSRFLDQMDFEGAKYCLDKMKPYYNRLIPLFQKELDCELLFMEIINDCRECEIARLFTPELSKYVKRYSKYMLSKKRLQFTYTLKVLKDYSNANKILAEAIQMEKYYPVKGDAESELAIMQYLKILETKE